MATAVQMHIAIKRLYVHDSIHVACEELGRLARETVIGDRRTPRQFRKSARIAQKAASRAKNPS